MIEAYLQAFFNFEQNNWARLLLIAEILYNNAKNASITQMLLELNYGYYAYVSFEKNTKPCSFQKS